MRILNLLFTFVFFAFHPSEIVVAASEERDEAVCTNGNECEANATLMAGPTNVGELKHLQFQDGQLVDPYAFRVKLPHNVTSELRQFVIDMGFRNIFRTLRGEGEFSPGEDMYTRIKGKEWYIRRPEKKWNSNSHWLNPTDEKAHDQFLRVLGDGGFDVVLDAIGKHFGLDGLTLYSVGFFALNHCEYGWMHDDFKAARTFNVLIPLSLAEDGPSEFYVESSEDSNVKVTVDYEYGMAVGVGNHTRHAAVGCDYRDSGGGRLMATLYLADIREDNVADIIDYYTDPFPPADTDYLLKWRGMHWNKDGTSKLPRDWRSHTLTEPSLLPSGQIKVGELSPLQFSDGTLVDPYAFRVKLPQSLTQVLRNFCEEVGFYDIFRNLLTPEGSFEPGESDHVIVKGKNWYIQRPDKKWHSNSHWLNAMDEEAHDQFLRVLGDGGLDVVLDGIGRQFDLEGLVCFVGFFAVNHCEEGWIHDDFEEMNGKAFNLLIPVELPKEDISVLKVESTDYERELVKVGYEQNIAIGVGDYTRHGTGECDYRETGEMRLMVSIYLVDIDEDNVKHIIEHYTDPWPPADREYLLARSGMHWKKDGSSRLPRNSHPNIPVDGD